MKTNWTNPASVTAYLTVAVGSIVAFLASIHPGFTEPVATQAVLSGVGLMVAGAGAIARVWHHGTVKAASVTATPQVPLPATATITFSQPTTAAPAPAVVTTTPSV